MFAQTLIGDNFLKKAITYILIVMVSLAYNYETIKLFSTTLESTLISALDDFETEEKSRETEESKEKNEKVKLSDDFNLHNNLISNYTPLNNLYSKKGIHFLSSDYSVIIYSPPETL